MMKTCKNGICAKTHGCANILKAIVGTDMQNSVKSAKHIFGLLYNNKNLLKKEDKKYKYIKEKNKCLKNQLKNLIEINQTERK